MCLWKAIWEVPPEGNLYFFLSTEHCCSKQFLRLDISRILSGVE